jgi:hypothetical protein
VDTPYGVLLYHPHSVLLLLVVELGAAGVAYAFALVAVLAKMLRRSRRDRVLPIFVCGVVASAASMLFDLFLFKNVILSVSWWVFLFGALRLRHSLLTAAEPAPSQEISSVDRPVSTGLATLSAAPT